MTAPPPELPGLIHLSADNYRVIGPEDFGADGLTARESIGPLVPLTAAGPLVTVHDSVFEPRSGIGHHPHRGMERLFYILEGQIEHDDAQNDIQGTMRAGDLGILTEGELGMRHSERNDRDTPARAYILVYPTDPLPPNAAFDAVRAEEMPRLSPGDGLDTIVVLERGSTRVHGEVYEIADTSMEVGASLPVELESGETGLVYCLDGRIQVQVEEDEPVTDVGITDTVIAPPALPPRRLKVSAQAPSRVLHVVAGEGLGVQWLDDARAAG